MVCLEGVLIIIPENDEITGPGGSGEVQDHQEHHRDDQEQLLDDFKEGFKRFKEG